MHDWNAQYEHNFGADGGKSFLDRKLELSIEQANQSGGISARAGILPVFMVFMFARN